MRFWIITSRILQNHLFWDTDVSQCGKEWIVLALKTVKRVLLSGGGFGGGGDTSGWRMDPDNRLWDDDILAAGQTWLGFYGCLCICWFMQCNFTARRCSFCTAPHVHCNKRTPCRASAASFCSRQWTSNQHTGIQTVQQGCHCFLENAKWQSQHIVITRQNIFVLHHVLRLLVTSSQANSTLHCLFDIVKGQGEWPGGPKAREGEGIHENLHDGESGPADKQGSSPDTPTTLSTPDFVTPLLL